MAVRRPVYGNGPVDQRIWEHDIMSNKAQNTSKASAATVDDALAAGQDGFDALRRASAVCLEGYGRIGASYLAYLQGATDLGAEAAKAVLMAKEPQDVIDVQIGYAQKRFDNFVAESTKISELSVKTANEALTPLRKRFDETVTKIVETASV
jgi:phasin family protein